MRIARLLFICLLFSLLTEVNGQVYKTDKLSFLTAIAHKDSIAKIERLAALEFHELMNNYRQGEYQKHALDWNDTVWLVAHNHTVWMAANDQLSHHQWPKTRYFTGTTPHKRCDYVSNDSLQVHYSGENALFTSYSNEKLSIEEHAKAIAQEAFRMWRYSPPHRKNMLSENHVYHGAAFIITPDGTVWSTSLFARSVERKLQYSQNGNGHLTKKP